jgi:hypothetical protein
MFLNHSHWASTTTLWHCCTLFSLKSHKFSQAKNLVTVPRSSFSPNPTQMNCCRSSSLISKCQPGHSFAQHDKSHLTLHNAITGCSSWMHESSEFYIIFITNLWHKLLRTTLFLWLSRIAKNNNMHQEHSSLLHFNLHQHYIPPNK